MPVYEMMTAGHQNERLITNLQETHLDVNERPSNKFIIRRNAGFKAGNTRRKNKLLFNFFGSVALRPFSSHKIILIK